MQAVASLSTKHLAWLLLAPGAVLNVAYVIADEPHGSAMWSILGGAAWLLWLIFLIIIRTRWRVSSRTKRH